MQHSGQSDVARVAGLAASLLETVEARRVAADDVAGPGGPLGDRVLLDERPDLFVAAFDLLLGLNQTRQLEIASSMRGYVPQRQRFPAMPCRISSCVGSGFAATSAAAETIWPGVQKPH